MASLIDKLIDYTIQYNMAQERAVDIFMDYMPDEQSTDIIININEYAGTGNAIFTDMSVRSIQIQVRSLDVSNARAKCWELFKLYCKDNLILEIDNSKMIVQSRCSPTKLLTDTKGRTIFFFNMAVTTNND